MRLAVGNQVVTVRRSDGAVTGGPIVIGQGATNFSATFLDGSGNPVSGLDDFELRVTPANPGLVTFNRVSALSGTLNRVQVAPASTQLSVQLWHQEEQHADVGPFNVPLSML
jgi:hypothetical protein